MWESAGRKDFVKQTSSIPCSHSSETSIQVICIISSRLEYDFCRELRFCSIIEGNSGERVNIFGEVIVTAIFINNGIYERVSDYE
jgi:hypothetical protein